MQFVLCMDVLHTRDFHFLNNRHVSGHELPPTLKSRNARGHYFSENNSASIFYYELCVKFLKISDLLLSWSQPGIAPNTFSSFLSASLAAASAFLHAPCTSMFTETLLAEKLNHKFGLCFELLLLSP